jgi:hypothetical protein
MLLFLGHVDQADLEPVELARHVDDPELKARNRIGGV